MWLSVWCAALWPFAHSAQNVDEFVRLQHTQHRSANGTLWSSDEVLFAVVEEEGWCGNRIDTSGNSVASVSVVAYARPQTVGRFCLYADGWLWSRQSSRSFAVSRVQPAANWSELVHWIETEPRRCLPSERGLLFEAIELICFGLGYKPLGMRQRQATGGGAAANAQFLGAPAALFAPHTRLLLAYLLARPDVWIGESRNEWHIDDTRPYEESIVLARTPVYENAGKRLIELRAQDASVPGQADDHATASFIAEVGRLLGYPRHDVKTYIFDEMVPGYPHVELALDAAHSRAQQVVGDYYADFVVGDPNFKLPELPGFRDDLDKLKLDASSLLDLIRPLDFLYLDFLSRQPNLPRPSQFL